MSDRLQRLLAAPRFADPETDRIARSAYTCAVVFMGILAVWLPAAYILQDRQPAIPVIGLVSLIVLGSVAGLARRGRARLAAGILVVHLYALASYGIYAEGGLEGTSVGTYLALVVAASLFFSARLAWATAGLSVLTMAVFWRVQLAGLLPPPADFGPERVLVSTFTVMAVVVALVQLSVGRIRDSQRFLREITDATPHALYVYDVLEGTIAYGNEASRRQLGRVGTVVDDRQSFRRIIHPDDQPRISEHGRRIPTARDDEIIELEYRARHEDGSWRTIRDRSRVFDRTPEGRVRQILGVAEDVTAEREAERSLEESRERLRRGERLEALGQLAGGIAHDFNNYLTVIIGATEAAAREIGDENEGLRELIMDANAAAERSGELTRQLLGFSQHRLMQPQTFQLDDLLRDSDRLLRRIIPENIEIEMHPGEDLPPIHADPSQIEQVVLNLAVNARDAMPGGGRLVIETARVEVNAPWLSRQVGVGSGPYVVMSVCDTGSGMDDETRALIFEPLFTTKGSGTGFGLATVDAIVSQTGGYVQVESRPGDGTRFRIYLPAAEGEPDALADPVESSDLQGTERILLVEDDPMVRNFTRRALQASGYRVTDAADGESGRHMFLEQPDAFDVVLTDIMLPGLSGLELAESLREQRPDLPVVYMSGYTAHALGAPELGAKAHLLHKPFSLVDLRRHVRAALDER